MTKVMYDSVTLDDIPGDAGAVAGYVDGYGTFPELAKRWPHAERLSITLSPDLNADCLDIENGAATPDEAAAFVKRMRRLMPRPVVYAARDEMLEVVQLLNRAGIPRGSYRVWSAHVGLGAHICGPKTCGAGYQADGTQWTFDALGRNLDESLLTDTFFDQPKPKPKPKPKKKRARPRVKVTAATLAAAIATGIQAAVHAHGVHIAPAAASGIAAAAAAVAGYLVPERRT